jgi:hypothetical protein
MGGRRRPSSRIFEGLRGLGDDVRSGEGEMKISLGRTPEASAAASEAGRFATRDEMIFLRNL